MFEIEDKDLRSQMLYKLGHAEDTVTLQVGDHVIKAIATNDGIDRTSPDGKTSAVHFLKFPFTEPQVRRNTCFFFLSYLVFFI